MRTSDDYLSEYHVSKVSFESLTTVAQQHNIVEYKIKCQLMMKYAKRVTTELMSIQPDCNVKIVKKFMYMSLNFVLNLSPVFYIPV